MGTWFGRCILENGRSEMGIGKTKYGKSSRDFTSRTTTSRVLHRYHSKKREGKTEKIVGKLFQIDLRGKKLPPVKEKK